MYSLCSLNSLDILDNLFNCIDFCNHCIYCMYCLYCHYLFFYHIVSIDAFVGFLMVNVGIMVIIVVVGTGNTVDGVVVRVWFYNNYYNSIYDLFFHIFYIGNQISFVSRKTRLVFEDDIEIGKGDDTEDLLAVLGGMSPQIFSRLLQRRGILVKSEEEVTYRRDQAHWMRLQALYTG